ncbi:MAG: PEP-CTERM sorting domain-containing protein [Planctomycetaceae bacterium]|nr:PEP-CTERM sorting domain-containing protein [Planctomycetaceae bacterium]
MRKLATFFVIAVMTLGMSTAQAQTAYTWVGSDNSSWMTGSNWSPEGYSGSYNGGDTFAISSGIANANGNTFYDALTVNAGGTLDITVNWAAPMNLTLAGGTVASSPGGMTQLYNHGWGVLKIDDVDPTAGVTASTVNVATGTDFYLSTILNMGAGGSGNLVKTGDGLLRLNGGTLGNWTGTLTIDGGKVRLENANALAKGTVVVDGDEFLIGAGFNNGQVLVQAGGVAENDNNGAKIAALHLQGGTLKGYNNWQIGNGGSNGSKIYVDSASTITSVNAGQDFYIGAQLYGTGDLLISGPGRVGLNNDRAGVYYSGTITIDSGSTLRMWNQYGLSGGTVNVTGSGGLFQIGEGFANGQVNVQTGGVAYTDGNNNYVSNLHLQGGDLQGDGWRGVGNGGNNGSKIFVDNASTISSMNADQDFYVNAQLNGSGDLVMSGPGRVVLSNDKSGTAYSGTITIDSGTTLRMGNQYALSGGTVNVTGSGGLFQIGQGINGGQVNVQTGGIAYNDDNNTYVGNLHLQGGTLQGDGWRGVGNGGNSGSKIYVDSDSTISSMNADQDFYINARLNGTGDLLASGPGRVVLNNDKSGTAYSGTITIDSGTTLRMGNQYALSGGTINVTGSGGLFQIGQGINGGQVNVQTGGVAYNDDNNTYVGNLHLQGGTLQGDGNRSVGNGGNSGSKIYIDSASTISSVTAGQEFYINARLYGTENLLISGPGLTQLNNDKIGTAYTGTITIDSGSTLRMSNPNGLSGGTVSVTGTGGLFRLGEGFASGRVNVLTGGVAESDGHYKQLANLHLDGGTLKGTNGQYVGQGTGNSVITVDSSSNIEMTNADENMYLYAKLLGSGTLNKVGDGNLWLMNASTSFTGDWSVNTGNLYLNAADSTGNGGGMLSIASGAGVVYQDGGVTNVNVSQFTLGGYLFTKDNAYNANDWYDITQTYQADDGTSVDFASYFTGSAGEKITIYSVPPSTLYTWVGGDSDWQTTTQWQDSESNNPSNFTSGNEFDLAGGTATTGNGNTFADRLNVKDTGTLSVNSDRTASNIHLDGGVIEGVSNDARIRGRITVDSASTISNNAGAGTNFYVNSQLAGTGNLLISGDGTVRLENGTADETYSGTITIASGTTLRMQNQYGLSGGTVNVNGDGGLFQIGEGFAIGRVNVNSGAVAEVTNWWNPVVNLHLAGGTLRKEVNVGDLGVGNGSSSSAIYIDSASTISSDNGQTLYINAPLYGTGALAIAGDGRVYLQGDLSDDTYSGTITIGSAATLRMNNQYGLSGGTLNIVAGSGTFLTGEGFNSGRVNVQTGGVATVDGWNNPISNLHLAGGTLTKNVGSGDRYIGNGSSSNIYMDSASTISSDNGEILYVAAVLNGTGNLAIAGNGRVHLQGDASDSTYSGTITVGSAATLRMGNQYGLSGGTVNLNGSSGTFLTGEGINSGRVNVQTGGVATVDGWNNPLSNLHLQGGTLRKDIGNGDRWIGNGSSSNITVDSASTISSDSGQRLYIGALLKGTGNLAIAGDGVVQLQGDSPDANYSGTITIAGTATLRMGNSYGLGNGTVNLTAASGAFEIGSGFRTGRVNVYAGGLAKNTDGQAPVYNMHLNGGTVENVNGGSYWFGENNDNNNLYIESAGGTIKQDTGAGDWMYMGVVLNGSGNLAKTGVGALYFDRNSSETYSGNWDIQGGKLYVRNTSGDRNAAGSLGSGAQVNIATGAVLEFEDIGENSWTMNKMVTGTGTVKMGWYDTLTIARNLANTAGGINPGNSAGITTVDLYCDSSDAQYGALNFAKNDLGQNAQWYMEVLGVDGVAGEDYDQIVLTHSGSSYAKLTGLSNVDLYVDVSALGVGLDPGVVTIFTGATNDISSMSFANVYWIGGTGSVNYNFIDGLGTITLTDVVVDVPEPATMALLVLGAVAVVIRRRRRA